MPSNQPSPESIWLALVEAVSAVLLGVWSLDAAPKPDASAVWAVLLVLFAVILIKSVLSHRAERELAWRSARIDRQLADYERDKWERIDLAWIASRVADILADDIRHFSHELHTVAKEADGPTRVMRSWEVQFLGEVFQPVSGVSHRMTRLGLSDKAVDDALNRGINMERAKALHQALRGLATRLGGDPKKDDELS